MISPSFSRLTVTERREQVLTPELLYRQLFESAKDGILILDVETGTVVDVNPFLVELLGFSREEFLGKQVWKLGFFKDIVANRAGFAALQQKEYIRFEDTPLKTGDGRRIDVEFVSNVYLVNDQRVMQCNIRDITGRKRAEAAERARFARAQQQLEAIGRISISDALPEGDVERLAREITEEAARVAGVERANVWLFNEEETELRCIDLYESSKNRHSAGMVLRQREFTNEFKALKSVSHVAVSEPLTDPRTVGYVDSYLKPLGITSMLDTVIEVSDKHIGLLCLEHVGKTHVWEADEIAFAGRLADKIPVAIANRIRKQGEDQIHALARFPDENPNSILRMTGEGRVLYANLASIPLQELFKASAGELARGQIVEKVRESLERGETRTFEMEHGERIFSVTLAPIPAEGYANIYGVDITEHKRADQALRESQQLIEGVINAISVRVFWKDKNLSFLGCNAAFARDAGFADPKEIIGKDDYQMAWREQAELYRSDDRQVIESGRSKGPIEEPQTTPEGNLITLLTSKIPLRSSTGEVSGVLGTYVDITERKRSEKTMLRAIGALKTLSDCNAALVHASDEASLLNEICRIIVVMSGYPLAWVGFAEHDTGKSVRAVAHAGFINGLTERVGITWDGATFPQGPVGAAISTGQAQLVQDAHSDPRYELWRDSAVKIGYRSVLCLPLASAGKTFGALCIYAAGHDAFDEEEIRLLSGLANELAFGIVNLRARIEHHQSAERLQRGMESTIEALAGTLELRDAYTAGHQRRVAELAAEIARELGVSEGEVHGIHLAATVHDLGKIQVPAEILTKPTRLTNLEYEFVKTHAQAGYDLLKDIDFPWPIAQLVYQHHERIDGSGYPRGLRGEETLMGAKILAVADTIEAMSSHRPYRAGLGIEASLAEITKNRDKLYDAAVVDACVKLFREKRFAFSK